MDSISIVVEGLETIVIAGDAMPTFGNFQKMCTFHTRRSSSSRLKHGEDNKSCRHSGAGT